jgi:hypothetical protein
MCTCQNVLHAPLARVCALHIYAYIYTPLFRCSGSHFLQPCLVQASDSTSSSSKAMGEANVIFTFVDEVVKVHAACLSTPVPLPIKEIEGCRFFQCSKSNHPLKRLLLSGTAYGVSSAQYIKALPCTDILERLKALKDKEFEKSVPIPHGRRRRYSNRETKVVVLSLPETCTIQAPNINDVDGIHMKVVLCKPSKGLWVELKSENIEYIRESVLSQLGEGTVARRSHKRSQLDEPDRVDTNVKNVFWSYERGKYRAVHVNHDDAMKRASTMFTSAKDEAMQFVLTSDRPPRAPGIHVESDVDGDDEDHEAHGESFPMDGDGIVDDELQSDV